MSTHLTDVSRYTLLVNVAMKSTTIVSGIAATVILAVVSLSAVLTTNRDRNRAAGDIDALLATDSGISVDRVENTVVRLRRAASNPEKCKEGDGDSNCSDPSDEFLKTFGDESSGVEDKPTEEENAVPLSMYLWNLPSLPNRSHEFMVVYDVNMSAPNTTEVVLKLLDYDPVVAVAACENFPLKADSQKLLCKRNPTVLPAIIVGIQEAINQTRRDLRKRRWDGESLEKPDVGQNLLKQASKETAYSHAVISAGVAYSVTKACARGEIRNCSCDRSMKGEGELWSGCGDNVKFGSQISSDLLDGGESPHHYSLHSEINRHNNKVGRLIVEKSRKKDCQCHGTSGACTLMTCRMTLNSFPEMTKKLVEEYNRPFHVDSNSIRRIPQSGLFNKNHEMAKETQLVYQATSANFCHKKISEGSLGTKGRVCEGGSGVGSCRMLCCGRGFRVKRKVTYRQCKCKFQFCCNIRCKTCKHREEYRVCR
eukprot:m.28048 g.28048  ORF g.28048 m.28048 type:complete len:481 (+) comp30539_c0_seq3:906-2348(+)